MVGTCNPEAGGSLNPDLLRKLSMTSSHRKLRQEVQGNIMRPCLKLKRLRIEHLLMCRALGSIPNTTRAHRSKIAVCGGAHL